MKMDKNMIVASVLVLLILITVVQAFQLNSIKGEMKNTELGSTSKTSVSSSSKTSESSGVPTNLQNLPGMVGGC